MMSRRERIIFYSTVVLLLTAIIGVLFAIKSLDGVTRASDKSFEALQRTSDDYIVTDAERPKENMSILLLGLDRNVGGSQRADAIILLTYNVKRHEVVMTRVPRDVYVNFRGYSGKINGVFDEFGRDAMINVVEQYLDTPITHFVTTDFDGMRNIVDSIGGIDIDSKVVLNSEVNSEIGTDVDIKVGRNHLNGTQALAYARVRYIDNDIERGNRQEQVIKAMIERLMSPSELVHIDRNALEISKYVKTNLQIADVVNYGVGVTKAPNIRTVTFNWDSYTAIDGANYVSIDENERLNIANQMRGSLDMSKLTVLDKSVVGQ